MVSSYAFGRCCFAKEWMNAFQDGKRTNTPLNLLNFFSPFLLWHENIMALDVLLESETDR